MKKEKLYAIVDIETTGGTAQREKIIEIAIALHDGTRVIDTFESLIHPERSIPYYITQITGIDDAMVRDAPKFYEVAKKVVSMTENAVFVAHNVRFDYSFVQEEFRRLGFSYVRPQLDTVRLSRAAFPGLKSYALGNLIKHFNIDVSARHRAMADVMATVDVFERILAQNTGVEATQDVINKGLKASQLPNGLTLEALHALPEQCGVYYFHDKKGDVVYVGKSINIQKRIFEHFRDKTTKGDKIQQLVHDISCETTGSELVALLLEDAEIKKLKPSVNKAQRRTFFPYMVYAYTNEAGYVCFQAVKNTAVLRKKHQVLRDFPKLLDAKGFLKGLAQRFELCEKLVNSPHTEGACFAHHIGQCAGACVGLETPDAYNVKAQMAIDSLSTVFDKDFFIIETGRWPTEKAVIRVTDGHFSGLGYTEADADGDWGACVKTFPISADADKIIFHYLRQHKKPHIIYI